MDTETIMWLRSLPRTLTPEQSARNERARDASRGRYIAPDGRRDTGYGHARH